MGFTKTTEQKFDNNISNIEKNIFELLENNLSELTNIELERLEEKIIKLKGSRERLSSHTGMLKYGN